ncbi:MAG: hypothetical protein HKN47_27570 [Pirellulaceae bacterium]|nr:hypothetical protein [Pirellulaceae bacterium]
MSSDTKRRWVGWLVCLYLVCLLGINAYLSVNRRATEHRLRRLQQLRAAQISTVTQAETLARQAVDRQHENSKQFHRLAAMMKWVRNRDDFLVRSGDQVVTQVISDQWNRLRLLVYLPAAAGRVEFAFREVWDKEHTPQNHPIRHSSPLNWETRIDLNVPSGVHEIGFTLIDDGKTKLSVSVDGELRRNYPIQPFRRGGNGFGPYFTKSFPNQTIGQVTTWPWGKGTAIKHELLNHAFDLRHKQDETRQGGIVLRCWLQSDAKTCASAHYLAAYYQQFANDLLDRNLIMQSDLPSLLEPYDGTGKVNFQKNWSAIHTARPD